jgi:hypothetical protein
MATTNFQDKTIETFKAPDGWRARVLETGRQSGFGHPTEEVALAEMKEWIRRCPNDTLVASWPAR